MTSLVRYFVLGSLGLGLQAATVFYGDYDPGRSAFISYHLDNVEQSENAGVMLIQVDGGPWQAAFCGDLFTGIAQNTNYDGTGTLMPSAPYTRIAWLLATALPMIVSGSPAAGAQSAALQLAIWDILHDNGDGLQAGRLQQSTNTSQDVINAFNGYLSAQWTPNTNLLRYQITFQNTNIPAQDLLVMVPEPGTFALAGLMLTGLLAQRCRSRRAGPAAAPAAAE